MSPRLRLTLSIVALLSVLIIGAAGYHLINADPNRSYLDAVFMTVITLSTVGYGEVWKLSAAGKLWTIGVIMFGIVTVSYALTSLISLVVGGELRSMRERKKMETAIEKLEDHIILCGFGRMGMLVVDELKRRSVPMVVIEKDHDQEENLRAAQVLFMIGDATDEEVLCRGGLLRARALVSALPSDADNVYVTLTAHTLRSDLTIIARGTSPRTEAKLNRAGATRVVCPQVTGAMKVANIITRPAVVDFVDLANKGVDLEIDEYLVTDRSPLMGKTLRESAVRTRSGAIVVAIKRADGEAIINPEADTGLRSGDTLILVGRAGVSERLNTVSLEGSRP